MDTLMEELTNEAGLISPKAMVALFGTRTTEIANLAGFTVDPRSMRIAWRSQASQRRLRNIVAVLDRITPWCGTPLQAYAWYRGEPIPSIGGATTEELVQQDRVESVIAYLDRISLGGYA